MKKVKFYGYALVLKDYPHSKNNFIHDGNHCYDIYSNYTEAETVRHDNGMINHWDIIKVEIKEIKNNVL